MRAPPSPPWPAGRAGRWPARDRPAHGPAGRLLRSPSPRRRQSPDACPASRGSPPAPRPVLRGRLETPESRLVSPALPASSRTLLLLFLFRSPPLVRGDGRTLALEVLVPVL